MNQYVLMKWVFREWVRQCLPWEWATRTQCAKNWLFQRQKEKGFSWVLYRVSHEGLFPVCYRLVSSFLSTVSWRCYLIFQICFWHICQNSGSCILWFIPRPNRIEILSIVPHVCVCTRTTLVYYYGSVIELESGCGAACSILLVQIG